MTIILTKQISSQPHVGRLPLLLTRPVNHSCYSGLIERRQTCLLGEQLQPDARIRLGFRDRATSSGEIDHSFM